MTTDCIFCQIVCGESPAWRVHETADTLAFFDINPVNPYHTLVITKRHYRDIFTVPEAELLAVMAAVKGVVDLYQARLGLTGVQLSCSNGAVGQQDVFHLHFHVIPRYEGDKADVHRPVHPELREQFDELLARLK